MPEATQPGSESMCLLTDTTMFNTPPEPKDGPHWPSGTQLPWLGGSETQFHCITDRTHPVCWRPASRGGEEAGV